MRPTMHLRSYCPRGVPVSLIEILTTPCDTTLWVSREVSTRTVKG